MAEAGGSAKVCVSCATDVSTAPRTKDAQGRYFCKPCVEKLKAKAAKAAAKPAAPVAEAAPAEVDVMSKLLADAPGVEMCPNCGGGFKAGANICIRCGFNKATGKAMKVQVELAPKEKGERTGAAKSLFGAWEFAADTPIGVLFSAVGALIGGAIGAGIYAYSIESTGYEVYIIALVIGVLAGVGAFIPVRGYAGTAHGVVAALASIACTVGGRYIAVEHLVNPAVEQVVKDVRVEEENIIAMVGRDVARDFANQGKNYQWPEDSEPTTATVESDFPAPIWEEAKTRYEGMDDAAKSQKRDIAQAELTKAIQDFKREATSSAFTESLNSRSGFRHRSGWGGYIKWMLIGMIVAFGIGSGGNNPFQD